MSKLNYFQTGGYVPTQLTQAEFIPTYAGQPLAEIDKYGQGTLDIYNKNIQDVTKLDILNSQRKVLKGDEAVSKEYDTQLQNQFATLAKEGDYENMSHQVNELARRHFNNKDLQAMQESRTNADKEEETIQALRAKGIDPWFVKDNAKHQTVAVDEKGNKVYNVYKGTAESPRDHQGKRSDIWDKIKPDAAQMSATAVAKSLQAIPGYIATGEWSGISGSVGPDGEVIGKIGKLLDSAMNTYKSTTEYNQELRHELELNGGDQARAEREIRNRVVSEGLLRTFSAVNPQYLRDHSIEDAMRQAALTGVSPEVPEDEGLPAVTIEGVLGTTVDDHDPNKVNDPYVNTKGSFVFGKKTREEAGLKSVYQFEDDFVKENGRRPNREETDKFLKAQADLPVNSGKPSTAQEEAYRQAGMAGALIFGGENAAKTLTEKGTVNSTELFNYAKQYETLVKNRMTFPSVRSYSLDEDPTLGERRTEQLQNHLGSRILYNLDTNEEIVTNSKSGGKYSPEVMTLLEGDVKNLIATASLNPKNPYLRITGNPKFADAEMGQIRTKEKGVTNVLVSKPLSYYDSPIGKRKLITNVLWDRLSLAPGIRQNFNIEGVPVEAIAIPEVDSNGNLTGNDRIKVFKVGTHDFADGYEIPAGVDGLINILTNMQ